MLPITVPSTDVYVPETCEFRTLPAQQLQLEHSLISLSKWEAIWKKSFLSSRDLTLEQLLSYIRCMTINKVTDESVYNRLTEKNIADIRAYIDDTMTATTVPKDSGRGRSRIITSEQIYGWMVLLGIPFDPCEKWHLNRLMMLIQVCGLQQNGSGGKKMSRREAAAWQVAQNAKRRARTGSRG